MLLIWIVPATIVLRVVPPMTGRLWGSRQFVFEVDSSTGAPITHALVGEGIAGIAGSGVSTATATAVMHISVACSVYIVHGGVVTRSLTRSDMRTVTSAIGAAADIFALSIRHVSEMCG